MADKTLPTGNGFRNITGSKYGRLTVVEYHGRSKSNKVAWLCRCDCGSMHVVCTSDLTSGNTKSCGCLDRQRTVERNTKHGLYGTREYVSWSCMKTRCCNSKSNRFHRYGGRGIKICDRWIESFPNFLADMGECPVGHSIDRIDLNGNYEPSNCKWSNDKVQARNSINAHILNFDGKSLCIAEWSETIGISPSTIRKRIRMNLSIEAILSPPTPHFLRRAEGRRRKKS